MSLLPFNASPLEKHLEAVMRRATDVAVPIDTLWHPATCPANLLPWLAWALSVDTWDSAWPESIKRQVIANSVSVHRTKGTLAAIRRVLNDIHIQAEVSEWFQHDGDPHTFRMTAWTDDQSVDPNAPILDIALYRTLIRAVDNVKPVRSHYDFRVGMRFEGTLLFCALMDTVIHSRNMMTPVVHTDARAVIALSTGCHVVTSLRIDATVEP